MISASDLEARIRKLCCPCSHQFDTWGLAREGLNNMDVILLYRCKELITWHIQMHNTFILSESWYYYFSYIASELLNDESSVACPHRSLPTCMFMRSRWCLEIAILIKYLPIGEHTQYYIQKRKFWIIGRATILKSISCKISNGSNNI